MSPADDIMVCILQNLLRLTSGLIVIRKVETVLCCKKPSGIFFAVTVLLALALCSARPLAAKSASEINIGVDTALERFRGDVPGGSRFLSKARGVLVFPSVIKAGFGVGGEYGEGALRIGGKTVGYYNTAAASVGFQLGAQSKTVILIFTSGDALANFRDSDGWKAGVDGSVALIEWGVGEDINTVDVKDPVVGFVFGNKGLMYNLTLEGSKYSKIQR